MKEEMFGPIVADQIDYELLDEEIEHINGRAAAKRTLSKEEEFDRAEDDDSNQSDRSPVPYVDTSESEEEQHYSVASRDGGPGYRMNSALK